MIDDIIYDFLKKSHSGRILILILSVSFFVFIERAIIYRYTEDDFISNIISLISLIAIITIYLIIVKRKTKKEEMENNARFDKNAKDIKNLQMKENRCISCNGIVDEEVVFCPHCGFEKRKEKFKIK